MNRLAFFFMFCLISSPYGEEITYEEESFYPCIYESGMRCQCVPASKLVDCSGQEFREPPIPENPMPIFETFSLKDNDIEHQIPGEEELLAAFPDLKVMDLRENPRLNCRLVSRLRYKKVRVISRCSLSGVLIEMPMGFTSTPRPTPPPCDFWCKIRIGITNAALTVYSETTNLINTIKKRIDAGK